MENDEKDDGINDIDQGYEYYILLYFMRFCVFKFLFMYFNHNHDHT